MSDKKPGLIGRLANALNDFGQTITQGYKGYSGAFTTIVRGRNQIGVKQQNMAVQQAGMLLPRQLEKQVTPEQTFDTSLYPSPEPTAASFLPPGEKLREPIKTETDVSSQRVQQYLLARFNPIRGLSPRLLSTYLEQWDLGFLRWSALVWNKIRERDDQIASAVAAREAKPADMGWEIIADDEDPEAVEHKKALEAFYNGISVTHALDQNQKGGVSLLIRQMMRAVGDKFVVHEIVWRPEPDALTAEMRFIPLWFFENRTGQLRFLPYELALQGIPLEPGGWSVHVGEGLFAATSIAYLFKQMGLKQWVAYMEKFGLPFLHGKTNAEYESAEWNNLLSALQNFNSDGGMVTKATTELVPIIMGSQGSAPHEPFCDRMDRAIARIWRGGDLSSMSKGGGASGGHGAGGGVGSLPQMENESALAKADAERISETLQFYVDRYVIRYRFGDTAIPKAKFMIQPPQQLDAQKEIATDTFLLSAGVPLAITDLLERYGRSMPDDGDSLAHAPQGAAGAAGGVPRGTNGQDDSGAMGNVASTSFRRYRATAADLAAQKMAKALAPLRTKLQAIAAIQDPARRQVELQLVRKELPKWVERGAVNHELVKTLEDAFATATVIGAGDGAEGTHFVKNGRMNGHH